MDDVRAELPCLSAPIGPGCSWQPSITWAQPIAIPCKALGIHLRVLGVRLADDPEMAYSAEGKDLGALALWDHAPPFDSDRLYLIDRGTDAVIRRIRRGARHLYLVSDRHLNSPEQWQRFADRDSLPRGELIWLGTAKVDS